MNKEDLIILEIKQYINEGDLNSIQLRWEQYERDRFSGHVAWDYVFQKIYIHACLKQKKDIVEWLDIRFLELSPIIKIALRQMFSYSKYLLNK
jgi:hypothetical protein